jgi:hypothetical protein
MKLEYINEIADTCCEFMEQVIRIGDALPEETLMARIQDICNNYTEHCDDTIDIDYKNMCFTVHKDNNGDWQLCENASYYIFKNGFLDTVDGVIDVEL